MSKDKITFRPLAGNTTQAVYLGKKRVGSIRKYADGFRYCPTGSTIRGRAFPSLAACQVSLGDDA